MEALSATRAALDGDDRKVACRLAKDAMVDGLRTAGELLDHVETLDPDRRRALLDRTRERRAQERVRRRRRAPAHGFRRRLVAPQPGRSGPGVPELHSLEL